MTLNGIVGCSDFVMLYFHAQGLAILVPGVPLAHGNMWLGPASCTFLGWATTKGAICGLWMVMVKFQCLSQKNLLAGQSFTQEVHAGL